MGRQVFGQGWLVQESVGPNLICHRYCPSALDHHLLIRFVHQDGGWALGDCQEELWLETRKDRPVSVDPHIRLHLLSPLSFSNLLPPSKIGIWTWESQSMARQAATDTLAATSSPGRSQRSLNSKSEKQAASRRLKPEITKRAFLLKPSLFYLFYVRHHP